jgi:histidyl-tRNA synthetase
MSKLITGVKGMEDLYRPEDAKLWQRIEQQVRSLFEPAGFEEMRTPVVEDAALFERSVGEETEIVEKEMYTLLDRNGHRLALRPEGTASVVRAFIEHFTSHQKTEGRFYYLGPMFRYERPQKGRLRQFHQIGAEIFGPDHPLADAELISLTHQFLRDLGVSGVELHLNSLGSRECRDRYRQELVAYLQGVVELLCEDCRRRIVRNPLRALDCKKPGCVHATKNAPSIAGSWSQESRAHFERVQAGLADLGVPYVLSPRLVRGLDYYERTVFEFIAKDLGAQNTVAAGGRYNDLVEDLGGPSIPGVGFALGIERLVSLLSPEARESAPRPRVYLVGLGAPQERELFLRLQGLREAGVVAELDYGEGSLKSKMKRADRWGAQWAVLYGEDEAKKGVVVVRNMSDGTQEEIAFSELFTRLFSKLPTLMQIGG